MEIPGGVDGGAAAGSAADGARLLSAGRVRPRESGRKIVPGDRGSRAAVYLRGPCGGVGDLQSPLHGAADGLCVLAGRSRADQRIVDPGSLAVAHVLPNRAASFGRGRGDRNRAQLRSYPGRIRGGADGGGQYSGRDRDDLDCDLRQRSVAELCGGKPDGGAAAGLLVHHAVADLRAQPAGVGRMDASSLAPAAMALVPGESIHESQAVVSIDIARRLSDSFELRASLRASAGFTMILGPSGSGKTTLLDCIAGLARPDSGRIAIGERVIFDSARGIELPPASRRIGYLFQSLALFPHLTVERNVEYGIARMPAAERERRVS